MTADPGRIAEIRARRDAGRYAPSDVDYLLAEVRRLTRLVEDVEIEVSMSRSGKPADAIRGILAGERVMPWRCTCGRLITSAALRTTKEGK